jgi:hypothetical protein
MHSIEAAMQLEGGLGQSSSLHAFLAETRARCGPAFRPGHPEQVAAMLLRVDASRQLLKPGGFTIGIRPGPSAPTRSIDTATMGDLVANVQGTLNRRLSGTAGLELLKGGASGTNGHSPLAADIRQALAAGTAIVRARQARELANSARRRAVELRAQRLASGSIALYGASLAVGGAGLTAIGLAHGGPRVQLTTAIGVTMSTLGMAANLVKDWTVSTEVILAPFRAWAAERVAGSAEQVADREVAILNRGASDTAAMWQRTSAALGSARNRAVDRAVRTMSSAGRTQHPPSAPPAAAAPAPPELKPPRSPHR